MSRRNVYISKCDEIYKKIVCFFLVINCIMPQLKIESIATSLRIETINFCGKNTLPMLVESTLFFVKKIWLDHKIPSPLVVPVFV